MESIYCKMPSYIWEAFLVRFVLLPSRSMDVNHDPTSRGGRSRLISVRTGCRSNAGTNARSSLSPAFPFLIALPPESSFSAPHSLHSHFVFLYTVSSLSYFLLTSYRHSLRYLSNNASSLRPQAFNTPKTALTRLIFEHQSTCASQPSFSPASAP